MSIWNSANSLAEALEALGGPAGDYLSRWRALFKAVLGRRLVPLKTFPEERKAYQELGTRVLQSAQDAALRLMAEHRLDGWAFGFNKNVRRAGVCRYPTRTRSGRIELSSHFVLRNSEADILDTILHEIAHALVGKDHGHDSVWKAKCVAIGAKPERCFDGPVEMPKGRWRATCPSCRREFDRHRRPPKLSGWYCKPCGKDQGAIQWRPVG